MSNSRRGISNIKTSSRRSLCSKSASFVLKVFGKIPPAPFSRGSKTISAHATPDIYGQYTVCKAAIPPLEKGAGGILSNTESRIQIRFADGDFVLGPGVRYWKYRILASVFCILCLFLCSASPTAFANESLQIAGMGGAFAGLHSVEGGIFGNSAGLISIQDNNLSVALSTQDLDYGGLPLSEDEQANTWISFRLTPSIYYSGTIKGVGISLGYVDDADSRNIIKIIDAKASYAVDERKFTSETDTVLEYDFFREQGAALSLGYPINQELAIGIKLKYRHRTVKEGVIHRPLILTAVHGEDVNRNDPVMLLPAIIARLLWSCSFGIDCAILV